MSGLVWNRQVMRPRLGFDIEDSSPVRQLTKEFEPFVITAVNIQGLIVLERFHHYPNTPRFAIKPRLMLADRPVTD